MKDQLVKVFKEKFGSEGDIRSYFAPGRVNLIGVQRMGSFRPYKYTQTCDLPFCLTSIQFSSN